MVGMLQELISRWVGSTTGNQWVMLIDAVKMCDEPAVAQELATAVGCPLALSGTTTDIDSIEIKLLSILLLCGLKGADPNTINLFRNVQVGHYYTPQMIFTVYTSTLTILISDSSQARSQQYIPQ